MAYCAKTRRGGSILAILWFFLLSCNLETVNTVGKTYKTGTDGNSAGNESSPDSDIGGTADNGGAANNGGTANGGGAANGGTAAVGSATCASADIDAKPDRVKPTVIFLVDQSDSTANLYDGSTSRWQAVYDALMAPKEGVITKLEGVARFGMMLYYAPRLEGILGAVINTGSFVLCVIGMPCYQPEKGPTCPTLTYVPPDLGNYAVIKNMYQPATPMGGSTPTALSLQMAYEVIEKTQSRIDAKKRGPAFVVLCTDGEPNGCIETSFSIPDPEGPIYELTKAAQKGIKTYVVGVTNDPNIQLYLDELATYGGTGATRAYSPESKGELVDELTQIVGGAVGCKVRLIGRVVAGKECSGKVELNGQQLKCYDPNGWKLVSETEIELQGAACETFKSDPSAKLNAKFPCDAIVIL